MNINQEEIYTLIKKCKSNQIKEQIFALEMFVKLIINTNIVDICQGLKLIEQKFLILAPHSKNLIIKCEKINYF